MKIGLGIGDYSGLQAAPRQLTHQAIRAEELGFSSVWVPQVMGADALTTLVVAGMETKRVDVCTGVVPIQLHHPVALAQQALTVQSIVGGRLNLGIGLSHKPVVEGMWGVPFHKPARRMEEFVFILQDLVEKGYSSFAGDFYRVNATVKVAEATPFPILIAALGDKMLKIAGTKAAGTVTWMTGVKTIASHIVPKITRAAQEAGKPSPRIVAGIQVCLTPDVDAARRRASKVFSIYPTLPSYRAMLDIEGAESAGDLVIAGDERAVERQIRAYIDAGATELLAVPVPIGDSREDKMSSLDRTIEFLGSLSSE
ncbi:MAG: LLM class F420-dependent oxidoreductase [Acidimicrobiia bacterium]